MRGSGIEALARLDYLRGHGTGWCVVQGPAGIGKSMLLAELAHRAGRRGDDCTRIELGPTPAADWLCLLADAWNVDSTTVGSPTELRRRMQERLIGLATMNRSQWLLVDQAEPVSTELIRGIRWLVSAAGSCSLSLIAVLTEHDAGHPHSDADLRLELWPWEPADCRRYVEACLQRAKAAANVSDDAIAALHERTGGVPGTLAKLCEWTWLSLPGGVGDRHPRRPDSCRRR